MYPLSDPSLSLIDIAFHWSRQLPGSPSLDEVLDTMWRDFWLGVLVGLQLPRLDERAPIPALTRREALSIFHALAAERPHPGVKFVPDAGSIPAPEDLRDGGKLVDLDAIVVLSEDEANWTDADVQAAYVVLSRTSLAAIGDSRQGAFSMHHLTRLDFAAYCKEQGFDLPLFWFSRKFRFQASHLAITQCRRWLQAEAAKPKRGPKPTYLAEALRLIPHLTENAFEDVWSEVVPADWKEGGRPKLDK